MDIKALIQQQKEKATAYCQTCGGSGRIRVNITGNLNLDFKKCKTCNGEGVPKRFRTTTFETITQHWRKEFN